MISLDVLGTPASKGSSRPMLNRKTGKPFSFAGGSKQAEAKIKAWDVAMRTAALVWLSDHGSADLQFVDRPLRVGIVFRLARIKGHYETKTGKLKASAPSVCSVRPDIDKLVRATLDPLTGVIWDDDARIVELAVAKTYAAPGREGARILIEEWRSQ